MLRMACTKAATRTQSEAQIRSLAGMVTLRQEINRGVRRVAQTRFPVSKRAFYVPANIILIKNWLKLALSIDFVAYEAFIYC